MKQLARKATSVPQSGIRVIMDKVWKMENVVKLMAGEPDFPTPTHIVDAVHAALNAGHTRYIASAGLPELRQAVAEKFQRDTGTPTSVSNILINHGAMLSVTTAFLTLLEEGDEILLSDPGYPNYEMSVRLTGATIVRYPLRVENEFLPDPDEIENLITPRTKCLVLCSPSNPTGQVYDRKLMERFVQLAQKHDLYIVSDEIYQDIIFEGEHVSAAELDPDRSIVITGVSKSYAMTGFRVGFMRAPENIIEVGARIQEPLVSCGVAASQYGALEAIQGPQDCVAQMRNAYKRRRDLALALLKENNAYSYTPRGAFYLMIDVSASGMDGDQFADHLLQHGGVAVAPGPTFGPLSTPYVRISLASSDADISTGVSAICELISAAPTSHV